MWKKVIPTVALCSFLLVGCNNNDDVIPDNNETPMEDVRDDINTPSPNTNNGMDNGGNGTVNDGNINEGTNNNGTMDNGTMNGQPGINDNVNGNGNGMDNGNVPNDGKWIKEPSTDHDDDELIDDKNANK